MTKMSFLQTLDFSKPVRIALAFALLFVGSVGFYACQQKDVASEGVKPASRNVRGNKSGNTLATRLSQDSHFQAYISAITGISREAQQVFSGYNSIQLADIENSLNAIGSDVSVEDIARITGCSLLTMETQRDIMRQEWNSVLQNFPELSSMTKEAFEGVVGEGYNLVVESSPDCGGMLAGCNQAVATISAWEISHGNWFGGTIISIVGTVKCAIGYVKCLLS